MGCYLKVERRSSRQVYLQARWPSSVGFNKLFSTLFAVCGCRRMTAVWLLRDFTSGLSLQMLFGWFYVGNIPGVMYWAVVLFRLWRWPLHTCAPLMFSHCEWERLLESFVLQYQTVKIVVVLFSLKTNQAVIHFLKLKGWKYVLYVCFISFQILSQSRK